jgi:AraC family transcriptional regulator
MHEREDYWLDLCLTPRPPNTRACYHGHWGPRRYQRLGRMFMLPPGEAIQIHGDRGSAQDSILCLLRPEPMHKWFGGDLPWTDRRLEASLDIRDSTVGELMLRLAQELREPGFASDTLVELIAAQLAMQLGRYYPQIPSGAARGGLAPWRIRLIDERLKDGREPPSLTELADLCRLSVRQLTRGFRTSQGYSIGDYMAENRVETAKTLLATGQSVKAIAYTVGFSSPSGFCAAFRRATLQTPGQYRENLVRNK